MPSFKVVHADGSAARRTKVTIAFDRGGMAYGVTDDRGYVSISGSSNTGKIIVNGREVWKGPLSVSEVRV